MSGSVSSQLDTTALYCGRKAEWSCSGRWGFGCQRLAPASDDCSMVKAKKASRYIPVTGGWSLNHVATSGASTTLQEVGGVRWGRGCCARQGDGLLD